VWGLRKAAAVIAELTVVEKLFDEIGAMRRSGGSSSPPSLGESRGNRDWNGNML
jgi:hypothetical protein